LLDAVTCAFVCLVQGVVATFGMRFRHHPRDWHTGEMREALPQTKPDIHTEENLTTSTGSVSGLSRESLLDHPKGLAISPLETINQDSRDKPENDPVDAETLEAGKARAPGAGRDPASAHRALPKRTPLTVIPAQARQRGLSRRSAAKAEELEPRNHAHKRQHVQPLASGSRLRASGMTRPVRLKPA